MVVLRVCYAVLFLWRRCCDKAKGGRGSRPSVAIGWRSRGRGGEAVPAARYLVYIDCSQSFPNKYNSIAISQGILTNRLIAKWAIGNAKESLVCEIFRGSEENYRVLVSCRTKATHAPREKGRGREGSEGGIKLNDGDNTRLTKYWALTFSNFSYISTPEELHLLLTHWTQMI